MSRQPLNDARIIAAWRRNAEPWTAAVREGRIASRRLVTDAAILDAVRAGRPATVLDLGCGEGWLCRSLAAAGIEALGVDAAEGLIERARRAGGASYRVLAFEDLPAGLNGARFDTLVCNFALLGEGAVERVFAAVPALLRPGGRFLVQTLHPLVACGELPYQDGWRDGSWAGCDGDFGEAAPWYFRTLESWLRLLTAHGLRLLELREPLCPGSGRPASVIFVAKVDGR